MNSLQGSLRLEPPVAVLISASAMIVAVIGVVIVITIIATAVILFLKRRRNRRSQDSMGFVAGPVDVASAMPGNQATLAQMRQGSVVVTSADFETAQSSSSQIATMSVPWTNQVPAGRYGLFDLMRSEWTKLRTVRSTLWTLGITAFLGIGVSALAAAETSAHWGNSPSGSNQGFDPTTLSLIGVFIGEFSIGVLGVLAISAEYGTGTIRSTLAAAPRRTMMLMAKTMVFAIVTIVVVEVVAFLSFFVGQALLTAPTPHATLMTPGAIRAITGIGLYVCLLGVLALGFGTIIRHTAGAISAFVGMLLILPLIISVFPSSISNAVNPYLPSSTGTAFVASNPTPGMFLAPWTGLLLLFGYALAALTLGGWLMIRRDA